MTSRPDPITVSAAALADLLNITVRAARKMAGEKSWPYVEKPGQGRGGIKKLYLLSGLPASIQARYHACRNNDDSQGADLCPAPNPSAPEGAGPFSHARPISPGLSAWQNQVAGARFDLCIAYIKYKETARARKNAGRSRGRVLGAAAREFCELYNFGVSYPDIHQAIGDVAPSTLEKWARALIRGHYNMECLAPQYGQHRRGRRIVSDREMQALIKFALHPNRLRVSQIIRFARYDLEKQGIPSTSSDATLRRALEDWKNDNYDKWIFAREGEKALVDKVLPYIERDASVLDVGECLVADGHMLNFQVINPLTGRPGRAALILWFDWSTRYPAGWNIMFTESTQNIHAALRRAILALGKLPKHVLLDNGKAFKAKVFTQTAVDFEQSGISGLYARLGIEAHFAAPYNARAKLVERFFGTFNELERLLPSYSGRSIDDKPPHMHRNERLHRKLHNTWVPTIDEANAAIRAWAWGEYANRRHDGLGGKTPGEMWRAGIGPGVDDELLRILMMSIVDKTPRRNGIRIMGVNYYHEALYGYRRPVQVRYDIEDMSRVHVYTEDGTEYLCTAEPISSVHPLAATTGNPLDMEALRQGMALQRRLKKQTEAGYRAKSDEIDRLPSIAGICPKDAVIELHSASKNPRITQAESERIEAEAARVKVVQLHKAEPSLFLSAGEAYEHHLMTKLRGEQLTADQVEQMNEYEGSKEYQMLKPYYDGLMKSMACGTAD